MTKQELLDLGLTEAQVDGVFELRGLELKRAKDLEEQVTDLTTERDALKEQVANRDKDLEDLKGKLSDNEELTAQLTALESKYQEDTQSLNGKLEAMKFDKALALALTGVGARDPQDLMAFLNAEKISLTEDGKLEGLDEQVKALQESKAYLFQSQPTVKGTDPMAGQSAHYASSVADAIAHKEVNLTDFLQNSKKED